ncbi:MAG TPA: cysteine desulfurase-like protein [Firmicutes bacterium]|nr:cysteine desulfurase-like protein [Bacillota bacterium]
MIDLSSCRSQFPALNVKVGKYNAAYLEGAGGTQFPQRVIDAMVGYIHQGNANIHGHYLTSQLTDQMLLDARAAMATLLGASSPDEIAFGANMTTMNFALSRALARDLQPGDEVIITDMDHEANRSPWVELQEKGLVVKSIPVRTNDCTLDYDWLQKEINSRTKIIAVGYASNAVGTVNDVELVIKLAKQVGAITVIDAVHYAAHGAIDVQALDCDFLLCSPYKFFGAHIGVLYGKKDAFEALRTYKVRPQSTTPPSKFETGTQNLEGIAGSIQAVEFIASLGNLSDDHSLRERVLAGYDALERYERPLFERMVESLKEIPGVTIYGLPWDGKRTTTVAFTIDGVHASEVGKRLGEVGVFVMVGDFYATRLIEVLDLVEEGGVIRAGLAPYNTMEEVERLLEGVREIAQR